MKLFNAAMQGVFFVIGFIGFIIMAGINMDVDGWGRVLVVGVLMFFAGFIGCQFFEEPARYMRYVVAALVVVMAFIYYVFHNVGYMFKLTYKYKKKVGTYSNLYHSVANDYYRQNSKNCNRK